MLESHPGTSFPQGKVMKSSRNVAMWTPDPHYCGYSCGGEGPGAALTLREECSKYVTPATTHPEAGSSSCISLIKEPVVMNNNDVDID